MAIKIIELGCDPKNRLHTARCNNCKTKFEFNTMDAEVQHACSSRDVDIMTIKCPVCHYSVTVYT